MGTLCRMTQVARHEEVALVEDYVTFLRNLEFPENESLIDIYCHSLFHDFLPLLQDKEDRCAAFEQIENWRARAVNDVRKGTREKERRQELGASPPQVANAGFVVSAPEEGEAQIR